MHMWAVAGAGAGLQAGAYGSFATALSVVNGAGARTRKRRGTCRRALDGSTRGDRGLLECGTGRPAGNRMIAADGAGGAIAAEALSVVLQESAAGTPRWLAFRRPREVLQARTAAQVMDCLEQVQARVGQGMYAAGFVTYEAGAAMDPALLTHAPGSLPLVWFGIYARPEAVSPELFTAAAQQACRWHPSVSARAYRQAIARIQRHITAGNTYQVNYTFRLDSAFHGDPWSLFLALEAAQHGNFAAYLNLGRFHICSASPELFFKVRDGRVLCKPMKGTCARGATAAEDLEFAATLRASAKNRAENVMIVDVLRNDLGKIAVPGSVRVTDLFAIEKFPTVLQMTSTVEAEVATDVVGIFTGMFPCASVTGAPKARAMQLIRQLETRPREIYTGAIGCLCPDGTSQFNVAIRTVLVDTVAHVATYGVGGGIVADSNAAEEHAECAAKARVLRGQIPPFEIVETMLWDVRTGYYLLEYHLDRLVTAATYFGRECPLARVRAALADCTRSRSESRLRVRVLLDRWGEVRIEAAPLASLKGGRVALATRAIRSHDPFVYHKTTHREVYRRCVPANNGAAAAVADVILWNDAGYVTESCNANVVARINGQLYTPSSAQGLLAGVFRRALLESGAIRVEDFTVATLRAAAQLYLVNSVRGWMRLRRSSPADEWLIDAEGCFDGGC